MVVYWYNAPNQLIVYKNKKVLLRERKRHTARRTAIASPCYSGGGGGVPRQKFFPPVWTCIKPNLVSKNFPFTGEGGGGGPLTKIFSPSLNMYQAKSSVKKISLYWGGGGGSLDKIFFSWSEHASSQIWCQKFFPLLRPGTPPSRSETGYPPTWTWTWDPPCLDLGPPKLPTWTWDPPPHRSVDRLKI